MSDSILDNMWSAIRSSSEYASLSEEYKKRCEEEVIVMQTAPGLSADSVLEEFYSIFKKMNGKKGSNNVVNSVVAYCLGITSKLPNLSEEFLPARRIFARAGFPDIDADFEYERRHEVYEYLISKYGRDRVGNIGTYGTLKMKSYITRAVKALDLAGSFHLGKESYVKNNNLLVREIIDSLPEQRGAFLKVRDDGGEDHVIKNLSDAIEYCEDFSKYLNKYPQISQHSSRIEGLASNYGVHAAGIVISGEPLCRIAPLRATSKMDDESGVDFATQFAYEDLEYLGLIKFDILALSTLSVISETLRTIKSRLDIDIDVENLPLEDDKTFELYRSGNLVGVFQCEERGMQKTMMQISVDRFEDICAGIALFRPGPMASIPKYCSRKKGQESIDYFDDSIAPYVTEILKPTYGILVYQEQVMQICNSLAGLTVSDGYQVIKAVGKKKEDQLKRYKNIFVDGTVANGVSKELASKYWQDFIMPFAAYGFNKCLSGNTKLHDAETGESWKISDLSYLKSIGMMPNIKLWSKDLDNNEWFADDLEDVFCTGEKEVFKIELCNGTILECTENHKFLCTDGIFREIKDISEGDFSIDSKYVSSKEGDSYEKSSEEQTFEYKNGSSNHQNVC